MLKILACFVLIAGSFADAAPAPQSADPESQPRVVATQSGQTISMEQLVTELAQLDVVFLGEQHDNDAGHQMQLQVIQGLADLGIEVVVSMEQFERDVQGTVDDYLAGRIDEETFRAASRPWKNYEQHYRPIVELARQHKFPVLGGNAPRRLASDASKGSPVKQADQVFLPRSTSAPEDAYWEKFQQTMASHGGVGDVDELKKFYAAQCLKDDAMAESITDYLAVNSHRRKLVVHLCGHFHSDYGLGTAFRVLQRRPLTRIAVCTMESIADDGKTQLDDAGDRAHYVFWVPKNEAAPSESAEQE